MYILCTLVLCLYGTPTCVNMCTSVSLCVSYAFFCGSFSSVIFVIFQFVCFCFILFYIIVFYSLDACLSSKKIWKGYGFCWEGVWEGTGRIWGKGNCNYIVKIHLFCIKEEKKNPVSTING